MWRSSSRSDTGRAQSLSPLHLLASIIAPCVLLLVAAMAIGCTPDSKPSPAVKGDGLWESADLVADLEKRGWEPPYFEGTIKTYTDGYHLALARRALAEPSGSITIGGFTYKTSPALIAAGREIFYTYHFGSHLFWDFRRAIDYSTGITDASEYSKHYGVKRDKEGFFVGFVGVKQENGRVAYGHSCALCHTNLDKNGTIVEGMANHDYDVGLYYEALRSKIRDVDLIYLGDAGLDVLATQGPARVDASMDGIYAPTKIPHLFALKAFEHGLRANGDMPNLWIQCYRNLNGSYAVDSEIMEALMAFLLSIKPPPNPHLRGELERRGETIFQAQRCHRCHTPEYYTNGRVIDWKSIGTDPDRIQNGYPKGYKVSSLLRIDRCRFYLHDGSLTSLEQMFDPARLRPTFQAPGLPPARRKAGVGVPGHRFGMRLSPEDRAALVAFLKSL